MQIDFNDQTNTLSNNQLNDLRKILHYLANEEQVPEHSEVSITFVDNEAIQEINKHYRHIDKPTDVISFALQESAEEEITIKDAHLTLPILLGEIVVSVEKAIAQAEEYNHTLQRELGFLVVHGFLHLLGYDHDTLENEQIMFAKQEAAFKEFNLER